MQLKILHYIIADFSTDCNFERKFWRLLYYDMPGSYQIDEGR